MTAVTGLVGQVPAFDHALRSISTNPVFKGLPIALLFLFPWFRPGSDLPQRRVRLLAAIVVAVLAIATGRALAVLLPHRDRPLHADLDLTLAAGIAPELLDGWSSLPSDHAVLFFALAGAFRPTRRRAGAALLLHALVVVALARVSFALHWPSDILAGAAVGLLIAALLPRPAARAVAASRLPEAGERHPEWMHPILFAVLFQVVTMVDSARDILSLIAGALT